MITKPCYKPVLRYDPENPEAEPVEVSVGIECRIVKMWEEIAGWATCQLEFTNILGASIPELGVRFSTKLPDHDSLRKFRKLVEHTVESTEAEVDEIHELLLYSPEGRASVPTRGAR